MTDLDPNVDPLPITDESPEPKICPECGAELNREENNEAVVFNCPECDTRIVHPKGESNE